MSAAPPVAPYAQNSAPLPPPGFVPSPLVAANGQPALPPFPPTGGNDLMNQILPLIANGTIPPDQVYQVLALLAQAQSGGVAIAPPLPVPANTQPAAQSVLQPSAFEQNGTLRYEQDQPARYEQNGAQPVRYDQTGAQPDRFAQSGSQDRYEQNGSRYRDRSRSPDANRRRRSPNRRSPPPNRRDSPTYGVYDPNGGADVNIQNRNERGGRGRGRQRGGRNDRNEYRQRTPPAQRRQPSPTSSNQPKFLEWDKSMPREHIKVLSRTLFVGGAGGTEGEIRAIFSRFGKVQTCIVNQEKRHAFVKMVNRQDAISAKEGMDNIQDNDALSKARQVRSTLVHDIDRH
jgi:protein NRD1